MPGTKGRLNASQFFQAIADAALPLLAATPDIDGIGFTFSYHIDIQPNADGILIAFSKEVDAPDVIGKAVGVGLREALAHKGFAYDGPIVLLNDTVATLLAGLTAIPTDGAGNLAEGPVAGLILGTGFNTAYPETSIPKIGFATKDAPQIVVAESGTYNFRHRGPLDAEFDRTTKSPGTYTLEKATSGAYIGPLTLHILKRAIADKVIRFRKSEECLAMPHLETKAFNEFANAPFATQNPFAALFGADEKETVSAVLHLSSILVERGAVLGAAVLAATAQRMRMGYKPDSPMRIAVEGTTFLRYKGMRRALESRLHTLLTKDDPVSYPIEPVDRASLYGAAVAAASRRTEP
jgi:hexokinase